MIKLPPFSVTTRKNRNFNFLKGTLGRQAFSIFSLFILLSSFAVNTTAEEGKKGFFRKEIIELKKAIESRFPAFENSVFLSALTPCPGGSGVLGGTVFGDFNFNGLNDQTGGIRGINIYLFGCGPDGESILLDSTLSDADGNFFFTGLTDGSEYRLDFVPPADQSYLRAGFGGGDFGSDVQFATAPGCDIFAAFAAPEDYCENIGNLVATCFVNGDPLPDGSEAADLDVVVDFPYNSSGQTTPPGHVAFAGEIGSVYGLAFRRQTRILYTTAFLKRHVGLGPLGLGGIYQIDYNTNPKTVSPFLDLSDYGISMGSIPSNSGRGLPPELNLPSNDTEAYAKIGKVGIGGTDISYSGEELWLVNLFDKKLYSIIIDADNNTATAPSPADIESFTLPDPGCTGGEFRPFAVKAYRNDVYVGGVCDAALSQDSTNLEAIVYKLQNGSFSEVLRFPLDYSKGWAANQNDCENYPGWFAWLDQVPPTCDGGATRVYPQPILSDIEFDVEGSMILGFIDRLGHQLGNRNYPLQGSSPLLSTISGGDILRAYLNDSDEFELENNGTAGDVTSGGAGNNEGPGGGEYYYRDVFEGQINNLNPPPHAETSQGGLAFQPGTGEVATTALDPYSTVFNSGGINWLNNKTSEIRDPGYMLYRSSTSSISSFSKANGLGDLELMCGFAPLQLGGLVWVDTNGDGIQDGCEDGIEGVTVELFEQDGTLAGTTTTDARGEYYFQNSNVGGDLQRNSTYYTVVGRDGSFDTGTLKLNGNLFLTFDNTGIYPKPDHNDSDATLAPGSAGGGAFTGYPFITVTTGDYGDVNHSWDFGFSPENVNPIAGVGDFVWHDQDRDGLQDPGEPGIENVEVQLIDNDSGATLTTFTDANGLYYFPNVPPGDYYVTFITPGGYTGTLQNTGNGVNDSDPDPASGATTVFSFDPVDGDNLDLDGGFYRLDGSIGGRVFKDCNNNGILEPGESGMEGIDIELTGPETATTTTDINGNYLFDGLTAGDYVIRVILPPGSGFEFAPADQGSDDDVDSDVDQITGETDLISLDGDHISNIFAGVTDVAAPVLSGVPVDTTMNCDDPALDIIPPVTATDNCDPDPEILFEEIRSGNCPEILTRSWAALDECGNAATMEQVITIIDTTAPVLMNIPNDTLIDLTVGDTISDPSQDVIASDNCDPDVEISLASSETSTSCERVITRTWTAEDNCGNRTTGTQIVTVLMECDCPGVEITGVDKTDSCNGQGGEATVLTSGNTADYRFTWIPNRGTATGNDYSRTALPPGVYLVLMTHRSVADCNDKIYFEIIDEDCDPGPLKDTLQYELKEKTKMVICPSAAELQGLYPRLQMKQLSGHEFASYRLFQETCLQVEGLKPGIATMEATLCDETGVCDTTLLIITVTKDTTIPVPSKSQHPYATVMEQPITIPLLEEEMGGPVTQAGITSEAKNGSTGFVSESSIIYRPEPGFHGEDDFTYYICNETDCGYYEVKITVHETGLAAVSGFSPNGDGINDYFTISGLERWPENELFIYNRWGNIVYHKQNYQNDWTGRFGNDVLPEGTYFYVLKYGKQQRIRGFVEIQR